MARRKEKILTDEELQEIYDAMQSDLESGECYTIQDERGGGYAVYTEGRVVGTFDDFDEAVRAVAAHMNASRYWPNVYYINERGNTDVLAVSVPAKGKVSYKIVASFV